MSSTSAVATTVVHGKQVPLGEGEEATLESFLSMRTELAAVTIRRKINRRRRTARGPLRGRRALSLTDLVCLTERIAQGSNGVAVVAYAAWLRRARGRGLGCLGIRG